MSCLDIVWAYNSEEGCRNQFPFVGSGSYGIIVQCNLFMFCITVKRSIYEVSFNISCI